MPQPGFLQIELTTRCNENCVHCYIPRENRNQDIDPELLCDLLNQSKEMGIEEIIFSGGEPMLHPGFLEAIDRANWHGFRTRVFSNLTLLSDDILFQLKKWQVHEIQTSLYSIDPEIHDRVTKMPGSCELTLRGIKNLIDRNINIFICCALTKLNKHSYPGVLAFALQIGANVAPNNLITAQTDQGKSNLEFRLDNEEALEVIREILENDTAYDTERFRPGYRNPDGALPCARNVCTSSICVNARGEVIPQPGWQKVMGDLNRQSLRDIWENSPEIKRIQNINIRDFPKCGICPNIQFCGMSLEGNANENPSGDPFAIPENVCALAEATRILVHSYHAAKETA